MIKKSIIWVTIWLIILSALNTSAYANKSDSKNGLLKISEIRKEFLALEKIQFRKVDISGEFECGSSYTLVVYFDENKKIRKFVYSGESCSGDSTRESINYFNSSERLYFQVYLEDIIPESSILKGNAYYDNNQIVKASFKEFVENKIVNSPYTEYQKEMEEIISQRAIKSGDVLRKWYNVPATSSNNYKNTLLKKPEFGDSTIVNSPDAILFEHPDSGSEKLSTLLPFDSVYIVEKGREEIVDPFGKNNWYKVKGDFQTNELIGWIYGAYLEYVETPK